VQLNATVLGGGSWGTTIASIVAANTPTKLWARDADIVNEINTKKQNSKYLPGLKLSKHMSATADLGEAVASADLLIMGVPSKATEIIEEILPGHPPGVLTGPNLAREIVQGYAAASVLAMEDETIVKQLQPVFQSSLFRVYTNTDMIGCELGGSPLRPVWATEQELAKTRAQPL